MFVNMSRGDRDTEDITGNYQRYSLHALQDRKSDNTLIGYLRDASASLAYLHSLGVIHKAVRPTNVMVSMMHVWYHVFPLVLHVILQRLCQSCQLTLLSLSESCSD